MLLILDKSYIFAKILKKLNIKLPIKIGITGPESTGKTWLAEQLAAYFKTDYTPEYAREYLLKLNIGRNEFLITATDLAGNQTKKNITIIRFKKIIIMELKVGSNTAIVNDKSLTLDVPPQIINGRTLVPIRFISEAFGAEVIWEPNTKSIKISYKA